MKKNTLEITLEQINERQRILDEIASIQGNLSSSRLSLLESVGGQMGTARYEFQFFVQRYGNGIEGNVPTANQAEMNRLKNLFNDLKNQYSTINTEKERLTADLACLQEKLASLTITIDVSVIRQQQDEIAKEKEALSALEQALEQQQARLDEIMASKFEDLSIIRRDLLAEKAMGKDVSKALAASEKALAEQGAKIKATENEGQEIRMTISGLTNKIEDAKRHIRYLEHDKKQMVILFLKKESEKTEKEYKAICANLIESYCRLRSLDTLLAQISNNQEPSFIAANAYQFKIPAIGPNMPQNDFLFVAGEFEQFGDCLDKEKDRLLSLGVQC